MRDVGLQAELHRGMRPGAARPYPHASSLVQTFGSRDIKSPVACGGTPLRVPVLISLLPNVPGVPIFAPRGGRKRHFHRSVRSIPALTRRKKWNSVEPRQNEIEQALHTGATSTWYMAFGGNYRGPEEPWHVTKTRATSTSTTWPISQFQFQGLSPML